MHCHGSLELKCRFVVRYVRGNAARKEPEEVEVCCDPAATRFVCKEKRKKKITLMFSIAVASGKIDSSLLADPSAAVHRLAAVVDSLVWRLHAPEES